MTLKTPSTSIVSIIRLLDDRDEFVRTRCRDTLIQFGEDALPFLEIAVGEENMSLRPRVLELIRALHPKTLHEKFRRLSSEGLETELDLEQGVILIAQFGHPHCDVGEIKKGLDAYAETLAAQLADVTTPRAAVAKLSHFLFKDSGFQGNQENYFDPDNSYFNKVLETKKGIPISLSVLCLLLAKRLRLPVFGVGMPGHFIMTWEQGGEKLLFDPYFGGRILTRDDCAKIVKKFGFKFEDHFLEIHSSREILLRMLHNLILIYKQRGDAERVGHLTEYADILANIPQARNFTQST
jgi:regulator of sirC expression with transglutaminase-like and TPR domain